MFKIRLFPGAAGIIYYPRGVVQFVKPQIITCVRAYNDNYDGKMVYVTMHNDSECHISNDYATPILDANKKKLYLLCNANGIAKIHGVMPVYTSYKMAIRDEKNARRNYRYHIPRQLIRICPSNNLYIDHVDYAKYILHNPSSFPIHVRVYYEPDHQKAKKSYAPGKRPYIRKIKRSRRK